jgi:hypothetical protein
VGLIRRGINYAHRLGGLGTRRQSPDASLPVPLSGGPSFPEVDRLFFASPFTGWSSLFSGVTHPYKQHVWVHACVNAIAQNISGVPLLFFTGSRKNKKLVDSGSLVQVMESPNPMMSGSQFVASGQSSGLRLLWEPGQTMFHISNAYQGRHVHRSAGRLQLPVADGGRADSGDDAVSRLSHGEGNDLSRPKYIIPVQMAQLAHLLLGQLSFLRIKKILPPRRKKCETLCENFCPGSAKA